MIIEELHREIKRRWDMLSSLHKRTLHPLEIDSAIYEATQDYIEIFGHGNRVDTPYKMDIEWNRKRSDMMQPFIVSFPEQPVLTATDLGGGIYSYDLNSTIKKYRSYLSSRLNVAGCDKLFEVAIIQHEDLEDALIDGNLKPSKVWRRAIGAIRNYTLYVYTNAEFVASGLKLTFVREPARVCLGTYTVHPTVEVPNPVALKPKVESDIPEAYHSLLVNMTVQKLEKIYGNAQEYGLSENEINKVK